LRPPPRSPRPRAPRPVFGGSVARRGVHSFPTRRSSDLLRCPNLQLSLNIFPLLAFLFKFKLQFILFFARTLQFPLQRFQLSRKLDRKSTRLNSSHVKISYAVFCLKKNKTPVEVGVGAT